MVWCGWTDESREKLILMWGRWLDLESPQTPLEIIRRLRLEVPRGGGGVIGRELGEGCKYPSFLSLSREVTWPDFSRKGSLWLLGGQIDCEVWLEDRNGRSETG